MTTYNVEIIVNGQDRASGPFGQVGGALARMGQIAGGILGADVFSRLAGGIYDAGAQALDSYAKYERLGFSLNALAARELMNSTAVTTSTESSRLATQAEKDRYEWLKGNLVLQEHNLQKIDRGSDAYIKQQEEINATQGQLDSLNISTNGYITSVETATERTMDMTTALSLSKDRTAELITWSQKLAILSPFKQEDIANTLQMAMGFGFTSTQSQRLTTDLVDFASATGKGGDVIQRMVLSLGQMNQAGKLDGANMRELAMAGLPMKQILADGLGVTTKQLENMIQNGLVPASKAFELLSDAIETDFGGSAQRQASTFSGLLSSLSDIKDVGLREFFTGTFQGIQPYLVTFVDTLSSPEFMTSLQEMGGRLGSFVSVLLAGGGEAVNRLRGMAAGFQDLAQQPGVVRNAINSMMTGLIIFRRFWDESGPTILRIASGVFDKLAETMQWLGVRIIPFLMDKFVSLSVWFSRNAPTITKFLGNLADGFGHLMDGVQGLWTVLAPLLDGLFKIFLDEITLFMQAVNGDWAGVWESFGKIQEDSLTAVKASFLAFANWITGAMGTSWADVTATWASNWQMLQTITSTVLGMVKDTIMQKINEAVAAILPPIARLGSMMIQAWARIQTATAAAWAGIMGVIAAVLPTIASLGSMMIQAWSRIQTATAAAWTGIVTSVRGAITGLLTWIAGAMGTAWGVVGSRWAANWRMLQTIASTVLGSLRDTISQKLNEAIIAVVAPIARLGNTMTQAWNRIRAATVSAWAGIVTAIAARLVQILMTVVRFAVALIGQWNAIKNTVLAKVTEMVQGASTIFASLIPMLQAQMGAFIGIGKQICDGILQGLEANIGEVTSFLSGIIADLIATVQTSLGIQSPSKVFAGFGANMMEGMSVGIDKNAKSPHSALKRSIAPLVVTGSSAAATAPSGSGGSGSSTKSNHTHIGTVVVNVKDANGAKKYLENFRV